ncbi:zinc finger and BTB domain-containing protein 16-like isoform X2 [Narcine bancroftii]
MPPIRLPDPLDVADPGLQPRRSVITTVGRCGALRPEEPTARLATGALPVSNHRSLDLVPPYSCSLCGKGCVESSHLQMHLLAQAGSDPLCLLRYKGFESRAVTRENWGTHTDTWNPPCREYNLSVSSSICKCHSKSRAGRAVPQCDCCPHRFPMTCCPVQAPQTHRPFRCNFCPKGFSLKHQLRTHHRIHTGEKPFECLLCRQRSRDYSAMAKHLRTHGGALPYRCTICQHFSPSLSNMQKHIEAHDPEEVPANWRLADTYLYACHP